MGNLFFPQLSSGAVVQFPLRKISTLRNITNVLPNGELILFPDSGLKTTDWRLAYTGMNADEIEALKSFFDACSGPLRPFSLLDPAGNLLSWSSDLSANEWLRSATLDIEAFVPDPFSGFNAFTVTNTGQAFQALTQVLTAPCSYQYCFSFFARAAAPCSIQSLRAGNERSAITNHNLTPAWSRFTSSGRLLDTGTQFSVGLNLAPGQEITLYGLQCEPQIGASSYRPTSGVSGIYANTFWLDQYLEISADSPKSFSTVINLQTAR